MCCRATQNRVNGSHAHGAKKPRDMPRNVLHTWAFAEDLLLLLSVVKEVQIDPAAKATCRKWRLARKLFVSRLPAGHTQWTAAQLKTKFLRLATGAPTGQGGASSSIQVAAKELYDRLSDVAAGGDGNVSDVCLPQVAVRGDDDDDYDDGDGGSDNETDTVPPPAHVTVLSCDRAPSCAPAPSVVPECSKRADANDAGARHDSDGRGHSNRVRGRNYSAADKSRLVALMRDLQADVVTDAVAAEFNRRTDAAFSLSGSESRRKGKAKRGDGGPQRLKPVHRDASSLQRKWCDLAKISLARNAKDVQRAIDLARCGGASVGRVGAFDFSSTLAAAASPPTVSSSSPGNSRPPSTAPPSQTMLLASPPVDTPPDPMQLMSTNMANLIDIFKVRAAARNTADHQSEGSGESFDLRAYISLSNSAMAQADEELATMCRTIVKSNLKRKLDEMSESETSK